MMKQRLPIDPFLPGMGLALLVAWLARGAALELDTRPAIAAIFVIQGLMLDGDNLRRGFMSWRVHVVVQLGIFVGFPLVVWLLLAALPWGFGTELRTGLLVLAVLPTTISTAVVYAGQSGGNAATALFNATLSNLLGILVVPLALVAMQVGAGAGPALDTGAFFQKIGMLVVAPFVVGQGLRLAGCRPDKHRGAGQRWCQALILYILLATFHVSFQQGAFGEGAGVPLGHLLMFLAALTVLVRLAAPWLGRGFAAEHRPAVFFCVTEKTLATGLPMATALFGSEHPGLGVLVLPILLYHLLQLLVDGVLASRWGGRGR